MQLLGCGAILREVIAAAELLAKDFGVAADIWSVPELHRAAPRGARGRALEPAAPGRDAAPEPCRDLPRGPRRAGDRLDRLHAALRRPDPALRAGPLPRARHRWLRPLRLPPQAARTSSRSTGTGSTLAALKSLAEEGALPAASVAEAIKKYGIDPEKPQPRHGLSAGQAIRTRNPGGTPRCWRSTRSRCRTSATSRTCRSSRST